MSTCPHVYRIPTVWALIGGKQKFEDTTMADEIKTAVAAEVTKVETQAEAKVTSFVAAHDLWFIGAAFVLGFIVRSVL